MHVLKIVVAHRLKIADLDSGFKKSRLTNNTVPLSVSLVRVLCTEKAGENRMEDSTGNCSKYNQYEHKIVIYLVCLM